MIEDKKDIFATKGEVYLRIKVRPGAKDSEIKGVLGDGTIKIDIKAPAENNRANLALIAFLVDEFKVLPRNVKIISGAGERVKLIKISV
jgi:hypothetical protein